MAFNISDLLGKIQGNSEGINLNDFGSILSGVTQGVGQGQEIMPAGNPGLEKELGKALKVKNISNSIADAAMQTGNPYAMVGGLAVKGFNAVDTAARNENGIFKSNIGKIASRALSPWNAIGSSQNKLREQYDQGQAQQLDQKLSQSRFAGNIVKNNLPNYTAPKYGGNGLKFNKHKSKFSNGY